MNRPWHVVLLAFAMIAAGPAASQEATVGPSYLRLYQDGALRLNLEADTGMHDMTPVTAYITTTDVPGPEGRMLPANTLLITGRAAIDPTRTRVLTITLSGVDGAGTYNILEHGGVVTFSDASAGISNWTSILGWAAGVDEEGSSGMVTITAVGDDVPGLGWPVKGHFEIQALGGKIFDPEYEKKRDQRKVALKGEFSWGL